MGTSRPIEVNRIGSFIDSAQMVKNPVRVFEKYRLEHGANFMFYFGGSKKTFVITDPDMIAHVLKEKHANYNKSDIQVKRMAEFQGTGLLNSHGEAWFKQRRLLSKGFSHSHLQNMLPLQMEILNEFMERFPERVKKGPVDIKNEMVKFTLRFVGKSLFGSRLSDETIDKLGHTITEIQEFMLRQIVRPYLVPWYRISGESEKYQEMRREADQVIINYIVESRSQPSEENDLLRIIMSTPDKETGEVMGNDQVMIEMLQLLVAGNETSSNALTWTFYLLSRNPEYIAKIREEVNHVFPDGNFNYEGLRKLECTNNVLNEALRMYPPFWMIDRIALDDDDICGEKIEKGTMVAVYIYGVHHNEKYWTNPWEFNPERFSRAETEKRHPFAFVPFGGGPRVCIGQNMALMQILLVLISVICKYNFKPATPTETGIQPMMILRPDGPVNLVFERVD